MAELNKIIEEAKKLVNEPSPSVEDTGNGFRVRDKQVSAITAIRYKLKWGSKAMFNYICDTFPEEAFRDRLKKQGVKTDKLSSLYPLLTVAQKRKVIQRLDKLQDKNNRKEVRK